MAVEIKISVRENCDSLYIFDNTGSYEKKCNETGWGTPNESISSAESAEFQIYPPGSSGPIIIDVYPDFPNKDGVGYELIPEDLGMDSFISGVWRFDYVVKINGTKYAFSCSKLLVKDIECCIHGKQLDVDIDNFESKEVVHSNNLVLLLNTAKYNAKYGRVDKVKKIIDYLYNKCKCSS